MKIAPWLHHRLHVLILLGLSVAGVWMLVPASFAASAAPAAKLEQIRDFSRLSFAWDKPVYLTAAADNNVLTIHFESPASPDILNALASASKVVTRQQLSRDRKTLTLTLDRPYRVRSFISGTTNGVDLMAETTALAAAPLPDKEEEEALQEALRTEAMMLEQLAPAAGKPEAAEEKEETEKRPAYDALSEADKRAFDYLTEEEKTAFEDMEAPERAAALKVAQGKIPSLDPKLIDVLKFSADMQSEAEAKQKIMDEARAEELAARKKILEKKRAEEEARKLAIASQPKITDAEALAKVTQERAEETAAVEQAVAEAAARKLSDAEAVALINAARERVKAQNQAAAVQEPKAALAPQAATADVPAVPVPLPEPEAQAAIAAATPEATGNPNPPVETKPAVAGTQADGASPSEIKPEPPTEVARETPPAIPETPAAALVAPAAAAVAEAPKTAVVADPPPILLPVAKAEEAAEVAASAPAVTVPDSADEASLEDTIAGAGDGEGFSVRAELTNEILSMTFPWQQRTAGAAFVRDGMAWIVFSTAAKLDVSAVNNLLRSGTNISQMPMSGATVLYIPVAVGAGISMENVNGSFRWLVRLTPSRQISTDPLQLTLSTEPPLKPHVFLPVLEAAAPVQITDPVVGDVMDILPVYAQGVGISPARSFIDFALLESSQGVVVQRFSDSTNITLVRNGVRISTERGAVLTPDLPLPEDIVREDKSYTKAIFFPYEDWKPEEKMDFMEEILKLEKTLHTENVKNTLKTRLRMVELYLGQGRAVEALGYLNNLKQIDPEFYTSQKLSALSGAANFLMQRYADAAQDFSVPELQDMPETEFWQVMLSELLGNPGSQFDYQENYEPYIKYYPPIFRQRLGIIAADRAIGKREYNSALKIFDQLNEHKLINEVADYINYLMGKIALETQQPEDGYKIWQALLDDNGSEFVKVRTEFSLIVEKLRHKDITDAEAVERLERLAIRWRGDNLELAVLSTLSGIYAQNKDWPDAIRVWRSLNEAFPNTIAAVDAARSMDDAFIAMFDRGEVGNLTPLEQLFLYHEYRNLIPQDAVGDRIVDNLTNKMIAMDMIEQAASLLDQRMRYRFEHQARSKVGAKLARIYLMDKKPEKALGAIQLSGFGTLDESLIRERTYITAEALLMMKRYEDLFLLLADDKNQQADMYRMQAFWQSKDWVELVEAGEAALKKRANPVAPLNDNEADTIVKLALAYVATGDQKQLNYLRDYFTPLMKGKPNAKVFEYLTHPYLKLTTENFDEVVALLDNTKKFVTDLDSILLTDTAATTDTTAAQAKGG